MSVYGLQIFITSVSLHVFVVKVASGNITVESLSAMTSEHDTYSNSNNECIDN